MRTNASVVDSSARWEIRGSSYEAAQLPPDRMAGRGSVPLREILTDPALIRIACLAVGISVLFLAIAAAL